MSEELLVDYLPEDSEIRRRREESATHPVLSPMRYSHDCASMNAPKERQLAQLSRERPQIDQEPI